MQTLTMNEQEMVAGGESWAYELDSIFDRDAMIAGLQRSTAQGAVGGAAGGAMSMGLIGIVPGMLLGGSIGAAGWLIGGSFTSFPTRTPVITITELGVGGGGGGGGGFSSGSSSGSGVEGSRCF